MFDVANKVAIVSGAASGIGRGMAQALATAGANVVLADVDLAGAETASAAISEQGAGRTIAVRLDVRDPASWREAAERAEAAFGNIHILCSNAGVAAGKAPVEEQNLAHLDLLWNINTRGMVIGVQELLPRIRRHGEGGHIVITSSVAGTLAASGILPYTMSKYAAAALGETLFLELKDTNIGASILCPGKVDTAIISNIGRDTSDGSTPPADAGHSPLIGSANPLDVGRRVVDAIRNRDFYIFTHPEYRPLLQERFDLMLSCFADAATPGAEDDLSYYQVRYRS